MLNYKGHLNESKKTELKKLLDMCKPFIEEMKKKCPEKYDFDFLYRGFKKTSVDGLLIKNQDRTPKDTPSVFHNFANIKFEHLFGWKARNGTFVATREGQAVAYGEAYIFMPVGDYKYVWSDYVSDFFADLIEDNDDMRDDIFYDWEEEYGQNSEAGIWFYNGENTSMSKIEDAKIEVANNYEDYNVNIDLRDVEEKNHLNVIKKYLEEDVLRTISNFRWEPELSRIDYEGNVYNAKMFAKIEDAIDGYYEDNIDDAFISSREISFKCDEYLLLETKDKEKILDIIYA